MNRDTVTRSWGPLFSHLSTTISSCCSMIMHGPMLHRSVHNFWKLNTSQFMHGQHTHWTCHPLSMFGMLWIGVYNSVLQFLPISSNFAFHLSIEEEWTNIPQATINNLINSMWRRYVALHEANGGHGYGPLLPQYSNNILEWPFIVARLRHTCAIIMH